MVFVDRLNFFCLNRWVVTLSEWSVCRGVVFVGGSLHKKLKMEVILFLFVLSFVTLYESRFGCGDVWSAFICLSLMLFVF